MSPVPATKAGASARLLLWLPVALMLAAQFALSSRSRLPQVGPAFPGADKVQHAVWFLLLGLLAWRAARLGEGWGRGRSAATILLAAALWGVSDEWHQSHVPGRVPEAADVAADVVGTAAALLVAEPLLRRAGARRAEG